VPLIEWGLPIILWVQGLGAWLAPPMRVVSAIGDTEVLVMVMPAIVWCGRS
jgi:hypothetical protein